MSCSQCLMNNAAREQTRHICTERGLENNGPEIHFAIQSSGGWDQKNMHWFEH